MTEPKLRQVIPIFNKLEPMSKILYKWKDEYEYSAHFYLHEDVATSFQIADWTLEYFGMVSNMNQQFQFIFIVISKLFANSTK